jgi:FKBP-type peptidyl-prolyl cis-trans isomerase
MRRISVLIAPLLLATLALAGCGGSSSSSSSSSSSPGTAKVTVTGTFDKSPAVKIPNEKASDQLDVQTLIHGNGPTLTSTDALVGNYAVYIWSGNTHKLAGSTYSTVPALFAGQLLPGLQAALKNQTVGSRVLAVIPPKEGYGAQGNPQGGVKPTDTLVFVIDLIKAYPSNADISGKTISTGGNGLPKVGAGQPPKITVPSSNPPKKLESKTLVQGTGPTVAKGQYLIVQYTGVNWRTGKVFDSSWSHKAPFGFVVGASPPQVITGWSDGLIGKKVGSRVLLSIPSAEGYGQQGSSQAGIKGTDTLVFVVDILGSYSPGAPAS